jgi:hypothetical protein
VNLPGIASGIAFTRRYRVTVLTSLHFVVWLLLREHGESRPEVKLAHPTKPNLGKKNLDSVFSN